MTRRTIGIGTAALALAAALGVVAGAQLTGGTDTPRVVRQVSDEGTVTPTAAPSPTAAPTTAEPTAAAAVAEKTKPAPKSSTSRPSTRSKVTDADTDTEPAPAPTEEETRMPDPAPHPSDPKRCYNDEGVELQCPR
ncbi:hypothetical protein [Micromonospora carbonacea]|uniref:Uncharacterized protein n=1 Tax=Micromonospora carbonacea TaxID=47853 RepID=A0A1C4WZW4_9ACTN|nr:hypothetical protein [Micromonospora carbonacea]SCF01738.1 hypothetical protein GA0070563_104137 [Micromonospora carbonacea]